MHTPTPFNIIRYLAAVIKVRATAYTRLKACDHYLHFKHSHWWKWWRRSNFATSHYAWGTNGVCECKMDVKSTWTPTWHWMDNFFAVTWTIFQNQLLEVGLTQNRETMALWTLTAVGLFNFIMCEDLHG